MVENQSLPCSRRLSPSASSLIDGVTGWLGSGCRECSGPDPTSWLRDFVGNLPPARVQIAIREYCSATHGWGLRFATLQPQPPCRMGNEKPVRAVIRQREESPWDASCLPMTACSLRKSIGTGRASGTRSGPSDSATPFARYIPGQSVAQPIDNDRSTNHFRGSKCAHVAASCLDRPDP